MRRGSARELGRLQKGHQRYPDGGGQGVENVQAGGLAPFSIWVTYDQSTCGA